VGGKNIIKMAELKKVLEEAGFCQVQTYIQSGNVLFKSNKHEEELQNIIESEIEAAFRLSVKVVLRTAEELKEIASNCPFSQEEISDAEEASDSESLYVALLANIPLLEKVDLLNVYRNENDDYKVVGREVFLLFRNSIRNSKLANNLHKLGTEVTVRNWKTMNKLAALANAME
jgi:uncharacterized protein (DUF1697 family)